MSASKSSDSESLTHLVPGSVHLWLHRLEAGSSLDLSVLSEAERQRCARFAVGAREGAEQSRAFVRLVLSRYAVEQPSEWNFVTGPHGKPELVGPSRPLEFNLSHSGDWLAVAVSEAIQVGVDVQHSESQRNVERLARRYFTVAEQAQMEELAADDRRRRFYDLWSLKEAWTKARGAALPTALGQAGFQLGAGQLASLDPALTGSASFFLLQLDPRYSLAVCCLGRVAPPLGYRLHANGCATEWKLPVIAAATGKSALP